VEQGMAPPKLLALTQKQLAKRVEEGKMTTYEELLLYLDIVKRQNKLSEAVALVQGPLGEIYSSKVFTTHIYYSSMYYSYFLLTNIHYGRYLEGLTGSVRSKY
jgi:hypothetical protein